MADSMPPNTASEDRLPQAYLQPMKGWRLWMTIFALFLGLLLSTLETTIVSTALVTIASQLGSYDQSNWVVVAYLLTYMGFLIIYARFSDIFGRKLSFLSSLAIFAGFSLACGVSQNMEQLIIFRALQGIGGAGIYSLSMSIMAEVTPLEVIGPVTGLMSSIFACSSVLGPVLGGVITSNTTWRWIFYLNVPGGGLAIAVALWTFPRNHGPLPINRASWSRIDWPGISLSLASSVLFLVALEEGGAAYPWDSPLIITSFVLSGVSLITFVAWETLLASTAIRTRLPRTKAMLPVFPVLLVHRRIVAATLVSAFLAGFPFMVMIVYLPQRFQIQDSLSPVASGIRMLPLLLLSAFGAGLAGMVNSWKNISFYTLMAAVSLQLLGLGLMTTLPTSGTLVPYQYAFQVLLGLGFGLSLTSLVIISRLEVSSSEVAITMGAVTQVRVLGGTIGVAIGQIIITRAVTRNLVTVLDHNEMRALMMSIASMNELSPEKQEAIRSVYGEAFQEQTRLVLYLTAASWLVALGTFKRHPVDFKEADKLQAHSQEEQREMVEPKGGDA